MQVIGVPLRYQKLEDGRCITYLSERLRRTVQKAGGYVLPIAPVQDVDYMNTKGTEFKELTFEEMNIIDISLNMCDGIIFPGGIKFCPYDRYLLDMCIKKNIPVLGICLGMQLLSCYKKDVVLEKNNTSINHCQDDDFGFSHKIMIMKNTKLYDILGKEEIDVNSFHNYHSTENNLYKVCAVSEDGIIEGIEYLDNDFNIGVQWHPEISYDFDDNSRKIIDAFLNACEEYHIKKCKTLKFAKRFNN